jgi:3-oxoacyl-[acyl-carrier-protein] synthase III
MISTSNSIGILGIGTSLPSTILTNFDIEKMVDTSDSWIMQRTGISERRILEKDQPAYELGVDAARKALEDANLSAEDIDLIIVATSSPDYLIPSMSCIIQGKIGAKKAAAFDLNAACSGFIYGMTVANQLLSSGHYKHILLVGCEGMSKIIDWEDRNTCVLFADGAGAVVLGPVEKGYGIVETYIGSDGEQFSDLTVPCCYASSEDSDKRQHNNTNVLWMNGGAIMKFAIRAITNSTNEVLNKSNLTLDDIKYIIPHQANIRILEAASKNLGISMDKMFSNVKMHGNMSAASIPIALDEVVKGNKVSKGDNLILVGFGGGLTWGSAVVKWSK